MDDFEYETEYDWDGEEVPADGSCAYDVESWLDPEMGPIKSLWEWGDPDDVPLKIAVIGAGFTGKKLLANRLAEELELPCIHSVQRTAHAYGAKLNKKSNWEDEFMIFLGQQWEQMEYDEFVIAGSMIETVAYVDYFATLSDNPKHLKMLRAFTNVVRTIANTEYTVFLYCPIESKPKGDGVRSVDLAFQREIDATIRYYMSAFDLDYFPVTGTSDEKFELSMSYLREFGLISGGD